MFRLTYSHKAGLFNREQIYIFRKGTGLFVLQLLCVFLFAVPSLSQTTALEWHMDKALAREANILANLPDSVASDSLDDSMQMVIRQLQQASYLEASIDSTVKTTTGTEVYLHIGPSYQWAYLDFSQVPTVIQDDLKARIKSDQPVNKQQIDQVFDQILQIAENKGYPFAAVSLADVGVDQGKIRAVVNIKLNESIQVERIKVAGDLKLKQAYLQHYLDLQPGDPFEKDKIIQAENRLESLSFVEMYQEPTVDILGNAATVNLYLDKRNANRFDILLGLMPSPLENRRFQLTGNVDVDLINQLGSGERLWMNFESLQPGVQELELAVNFPFIFGWPFGADGHFDLYKRDSSYIDIGYEIGIQYFTKRSNYVKFFTERDATNLINVDTDQIRASKELPPFLDLSQQLFGVEYFHENFDYPFNPRRGFELRIRASAGNKKIAENETIISITDPEDPSFDYASLYDDLDLNSFLYRLQADISYFIPIFDISTIKLASRNGLVGSGQALFLNELYRIGGFKLLRGFNEESIFSSFYSVFTTEYRLLFNRNSNIFLFTDLAYSEEKTDLGFDRDRLLGLGVGLNLETKVGIFNISYALGGQKDVPLSLRTGRVHFGMVAQF